MKLEQAIIAAKANPRGLLIGYYSHRSQANDHFYFDDINECWWYCKWPESEFKRTSEEELMEMAKKDQLQWETTSQKKRLYEHVEAELTVSYSTQIGDSGTGTREQLIEWSNQHITEYLKEKGLDWTDVTNTTRHFS